MPFDLPPALTKRAGPLPVWSWLFVGAAGVGGIIFYMKKRNATTSSANVSDLVPSTNLGAGTAPTSTDIGSGGGGASDTGSGSPITNNYYYGMPPGSPSVPQPIVTPYYTVYTVPGGQTGPVTIDPTGDSVSNPGWNSITPSSSNPQATIQATQGSPGTIAGMSILTVAGKQIQVPNSTIQWFEQHPPSTGAIQNVQPGGPEIAVPINTPSMQAAGGGPYWVDVAAV